MTDIYGATPVTDDVTEEPSTTNRLDRAASTYLAQSGGRTFAPTTSVREAVRNDLRQGRDWASAKAEAARDAIVEQPLTATAYAVGVGILIGLLLRR